MKFSQDDYRIGIYIAKTRASLVTYLHTGCCCRFRRGGRPAAAEEALPDAVGVAGGAPGAGAAAERAHVGLLRAVPSQRSQRESPLGP